MRLNSFRGPIAICVIPLLGILALPLHAQTWVATGNMTIARVDDTATLLQDGRVLVVGGQNSTSYLASAELYDPTTGTFTATGSMSVARAGHTATLLPNGEVLITGGGNSTTGPLSSAELYDPATGIFSATGSMASSRSSHAAALLPNGEVLVVGGNPGPDGQPNATATAEVYDPATGTFSMTGSMEQARNEGFVAVLLGTSKILITGGFPGGFGVNFLSEAEQYDPATGTFTQTGGMNVPRSSFGATLLNNGKVLIIGGYETTLQGSDLSSAELYDPSTGTFTLTGSLATAGGNRASALLNNGDVFVAGGQQIGESIWFSDAEIYDPVAGTFVVTASMPVARGQATATLLNNGEVLVAGGVNSSGVLASAELFQPVAASTTTTVSSSANPAVYGQSATLTATVTPSSGTGTPTGTVTFSEGTTVLGTESMTNGQATFSAVALSVGTHSITAAYSGDSNFTASTGSFTETVNPASTTTSLISSANPSILNSSVTFTATLSVVAPGAGTPSGAIAFKDGSTLLATVAINSAGQATFSTSTLAASSHSITAAYSGDSNFNASASAALNQLVQYEPMGTLCDGGVGHQILPPIDPSGTSVFNQGRTVPAKFRVCDANGISIGAPGVVSSFFLTQIISGTVTSTVEDVVDTNNPDTAFRWDSTNQQWIFNISTQGLSAGSTYIYTIMLNDGTAISFQYGLR